MTDDVSSDESAATPTRPRTGAGLRLLPWAGSEGKPCYLRTDDKGGFLSRLADDVEEAHLDAADTLLGDAEGVLDGYDGHSDRQKSAGALHALAVRLAGALHDTRRVAVSRGMRLPRPAYLDDDPYGEEP